MQAARLDFYLLSLACLLRGDRPVAGSNQARLQHLLAYLVLHPPRRRRAAISRRQLAFSFAGRRPPRPSVSTPMPMVRPGGAGRDGVAELYDPPARCDHDKCTINAYRSDPENIKQAVDKIMGESELKGTPHDLVWAGKWQAEL